ncbi:MAG: hypothetical protein OXC37_00140 [Bdellovibrionaceae bacterium]|nr:hypothetical protein [Pseudobdellovibrionaceae bacterium]
MKLIVTLFAILSLLSACGTKPTPTIINNDDQETKFNDQVESSNNKKTNSDINKNLEIECQELLNKKEQARKELENQVNLVISKNDHITNLNNVKNQLKDEQKSDKYDVDNIINNLKKEIEKEQHIMNYIKRILAVLTDDYQVAINNFNSRCPKSTH